MGRIFSVFLLVVLLAAAALFFKDEEAKLNSPVPKIKGAAAKDILVDNYWFPKLSSLTASKSVSDLNLSAKSALLVNYESGEIIFDKNSKERLPTASTIKIMTALIALESSSLERNFTVSAKAAGVGEDSMDLAEGEKLTLSELLYGLMLVSGNDAAVTIAEGVGGSEDAFVAMMNNKLKSLGLSDTKFINASGLDEDNKDQYSTAFDLATIAHYSFEKYPIFRQIVSTEHYVISETSDHKAFDLYNETNLLTTYPGVRGIKPGFTWDAGWCLVTYAQNNGKKLIGVILGSSDRRGEMKELLDYGFSKYGIRVSHPALDL